MRGYAIAIVLAISLTVAAACGRDVGPATTGERIEISTNDELRFEPAAVQVEEGQTVTFVVTNTGSVDHEFTIGDDATMGMMSSGGQMMSGGMDHGGGLSVALPPGETAEMTVTFNDTGTIPFACHLNGHDQAGMTGAITVT